MIETMKMKSSSVEQLICSTTVLSSLSHKLVQSSAEHGKFLFEKWNVCWCSSQCWTQQNCSASSGSRRFESFPLSVSSSLFRFFFGFPIDLHWSLLAHDELCQSSSPWTNPIVGVLLRCQMEEEEVPPTSWPLRHGWSLDWRTFHRRERKRRISPFPVQSMEIISIDELQMLAEEDIFPSPHSLSDRWFSSSSSSSDLKAGEMRPEHVQDQVKQFSPISCSWICSFDIFSFIALLDRMNRESDEWRMDSNEQIFGDFLFAFCWKKWSKEKFLLILSCCSDDLTKKTSSLAGFQWISGEKRCARWTSVMARNSRHSGVRALSKSFSSFLVLFALHRRTIGGFQRNITTNTNVDRLVSVRWDTADLNSIELEQRKSNSCKWHGGTNHRRSVVGMANDPSTPIGLSLGIFFCLIASLDLLMVSDVKEAKHQIWRVSSEMIRCRATKDEEKLSKNEPSDDLCTEESDQREDEDHPTEKIQLGAPRHFLDRCPIHRWKQVEADPNPTTSEEEFHCSSSSAGSPWFSSISSSHVEGYGKGKAPARPSPWILQAERRAALTLISGDFPSSFSFAPSTRALRSTPTTLLKNFSSWRREKRMSISLFIHQSHQWTGWIGHFHRQWHFDMKEMRCSSLTAEALLAMLSASRAKHRLKWESLLGKKIVNDWRANQPWSCKARKDVRSIDFSAWFQRIDHLALVQPNALLVEMFSGLFLGGCVHSSEAFNRFDNISVFVKEIEDNRIVDVRLLTDEKDETRVDLFEWFSDREREDLRARTTGDQETMWLWLQIDHSFFSEKELSKGICPGGAQRVGEVDRRKVCRFGASFGGAMLGTLEGYDINSRTLGVSYATLFFTVYSDILPFIVENIQWEEFHSFSINREWHGQSKYSTTVSDLTHARRHATESNCMSLQDHRQKQILIARNHPIIVLQDAFCRPPAHTTHQCFYISPLDI